MQDFTSGPLNKHLISTAIPIAIGMLFQTLYYLVDLYFVGQLGDAQLAGVSAAGVVMFVFMALTQILTVGTVALISHAIGRKDKAQANLLFNQSLTMSLLMFVVTLVVAMLLASTYMHLVGADELTRSYGLSYLYWYIPGMALQFGLVSMGSALRGTGVVKPTMNIQLISVLINIILSPVLISGWGTGVAMGVTGAALASTISVVAGIIMLTLYFLKADRYIKFDTGQWRPNWVLWKQMLKVGVPAGGEFAIMFVMMVVNYWVIAGFGADAQAGFGVGSRIMHLFFLPGMAIAFSVAPVAGQNFGAGQMNRVTQVFKLASIQISIIMLIFAVLCYWQSERLSAIFSKDTDVIAYSSLFLQIIVWNFVTSGLIFTCSGLFQALGNTLPSLLSSMTRLVTFMLPVIYFSQSEWLQLKHVWYLSLATVTLQCAISVWLAVRAMRQQSGIHQPV